MTCSWPGTRTENRSAPSAHTSTVPCARPVKPGSPKEDGAGAGAGLVWSVAPPDLAQRANRHGVYARSHAEEARSRVADVRRGACRCNGRMRRHLADHVFSRITIQYHWRIERDGRDDKRGHLTYC